VAAGYTGFGFFEFALLGVPILTVAVLFMVTIGRRLLPAREAGTPPLAPSDWFTRISDSYGLENRLFQLRVRRGSPLIGRTLGESRLNNEYNVLVLAVEAAVPAGSHERLSPALSGRIRTALRPGAGANALPGPESVLQPDDLLVVKAAPESVEQAAVAFNLGVQEIEASGDQLAGVLLSPEAGMAEVLLTPRSVYAGSTIAESQFAQKFGVAVVTLLRGGERMRRQLTPLAFGDSLLVYGPWSNIARLRSESENFVVVGAPESMATQVVKPNLNTWLSVLILAAMVLLMLTKLVPTVMAVLLAAVAMVLVRCVSPDDAYRSINWGTVVLLAATLPMSTALQVTGGADLIANTLVNTLGQGGPYLLMAGIFLLTAGLSQVISNTATTVLLTPIVIATSQTLGIQPYAPMMMVAVGASAAFLTPIASPVNTLVFAPGGYRFGDYAKVGLPLLLLALVVSVVLAPLIWPLH
jgi:di/tricarboxylate transporter